jgi:hypothetical protein
MTRRAGVRLALALGLGLAPVAAVRPEGTTRAAAAPAFAGRYKLVLTPASYCPAAVRVGPLSVVMTVAENAVTAGAEVSGASAAADETTDDGRFVFLRVGDKLHGASGSANDALGLRTQEGYRVWMQIMADGSATTASGKASASGSAFGEIDLARPGDPDADTIGYCSGPSHTWSLEPA